MDQPFARYELPSGIGWIAVGAAIVYGAWTMDRLENLGINPYTAPGLVPGVLGAVIALCGALMALRALRAPRPRAAGGGAQPPIFTARVALSLMLCLGFALGLVGRGPPFWAAAALFLLHIFLFEFVERRDHGTLGRGLLVALAVSAGTSFVITMVFQELFLVRLP